MKLIATLATRCRVSVDTRHARGRRGGPRAGRDDRQRHLRHAARDGRQARRRLRRHALDDGAGSLNLDTLHPAQLLGSLGRQATTDSYICSSHTGLVATGSEKWQAETCPSRPLGGCDTPRRPSRSPGRRCRRTRPARRTRGWWCCGGRLVPARPPLPTAARARLGRGVGLLGLSDLDQALTPVACTFTSRTCAGRRAEGSASGWRGNSELRTE